MTEYPFRAKVFLNNTSLQITIPKKDVAKFLEINEGDWVRVKDIEKIDPPKKKNKEEKK